MFKNVATKIALFAFDTTTGAAKTGDAANLTAYVSKDYGAVTVLADTTATEMDATNAKGWYLFDVAQAESNADDLLFTCKSSTANISVVGQYIHTTPNRFTTMVIDPSGLVDANAVKVGPTGSGTAQTARDIGASVLLSAGTGTGQIDFTSGVVKSNLSQILGTALTETAGQIAAAFKKFFNIATPAATMDHLVLVDTVTTATTATNLTNAPTAGDLTAAMKTSVANAVWDEATSGHATGGTTGAALTSAGSAGDPWATAIPGAYGTGTAGSIVGANLDAAISTRLASAGYTAPDNATITAIAGYVDTEVAAIKAKTDLLPAAPAAVGDIPTALQNADALLNRDMSAVSDTTARSPLNALRFLRNKWALAGTTLSVKKEDDTTEAWNAAVSTSPGADPISGSDPA